jgi:hypothetical protein
MTPDKAAGAVPQGGLPPYGIDTANHASVRIRGYTAEQMQAAIAERDARIAELEAERDEYIDRSAQKSAEVIQQRIRAEAAEAQLATLTARLGELEKDAARWRWLRDSTPCSLHVSRNDDHAPNYMTAAQWIAEFPDAFTDDPPDEVRRMVETNTIWTVQIYPNTPVGFNWWHASTLDAALDAAMSAGEAG